MFAYFNIKIKVISAGLYYFVSCIYNVVSVSPKYSILSGWIQGVSFYPLRTSQQRSLLEFTYFYGKLSTAGCLISFFSHF